MSDQIGQTDRVIDFIVQENIDWQYGVKKEESKETKDIDTIMAFAVVKKIGM